MRLTELYTQSWGIVGNLLIDVSGCIVSWSIIINWAKFLCLFKCASSCSFMIEWALATVFVGPAIYK